MERDEGKRRVGRLGLRGEERKHWQWYETRILPVRNSRVSETIRESERELITSLREEEFALILGGVAGVVRLAIGG